MDFKVQCKSRINLLKTQPGGSNQLAIPNNFQIEDQDAYRDAISTVDANGKRIWLFPKQSKGRLTNFRQYLYALWVVVFLGIPFIKISGEPLFKFNLFEREFVFFAQPFYPQDFHLVVIGVIIFFIFIALFTVTYGRLFCGFACPQTVFMEGYFRRIEYWIEGDANQQKKLESAPWDAAKIGKKVAKHTIFLLFSAIIGHWTMAYLVGYEKAIEFATNTPSENWSGFIGLIAFTAIFYLVFAKLREQACTTICPYGRLQGVLYVKDTITVIYDWVRGEKRAHLKEQKEAPVGSFGDCIDCKLCVQVCPTGIDIRNGTQLECVGCTACIDACDEVMFKIEKPRGLIRFDSHNGIEQKKPWKLNARSIAYTIILILLIAGEGVLLANRGQAEITVLRVPGQRYQETKGGYISNLYNFQVVNKTSKPMNLVSTLEGKPGSIRLVGNNFIKAVPGEPADIIAFIDIKLENLNGMKNTIKVVFTDEEGNQVDAVTTNFIGPTN